MAAVTAASTSIVTASRKPMPSASPSPLRRLRISPLAVVGGFGPPDGTQGRLQFEENRAGADHRGADGDQRRQTRSADPRQGRVGQALHHLASSSPTIRSR
jgi:hypothetical protein